MPVFRHSSSTLHAGMICGQFDSPENCHFFCHHHPLQHGSAIKINVSILAADGNWWGVSNQPYGRGGQGAHRVWTIGPALKWTHFSGTSLIWTHQTAVENVSGASISMTFQCSAVVLPSQDQNPPLALENLQTFSGRYQLFTN